MLAKTLYELCKPRDSVFTNDANQYALDLDNLSDGSINPEEFFNETYVTEGMNILLDTAFQRFRGDGETGLLKLTQSMGGGKTHAMIGLGLLAKYPKLRKKILSKLYGDKFETVTQDITVVSYTGRNSDLQYGIWGEIARQLGKLEGNFYKEYCEKLQAPGQTAWINLLKGKPLLILLDELPPYLDYIKTIPIGKGTLADTTKNALANLFNALGKKDLSNVCVVISDLTATYESGSRIIEETFKDLNAEMNRHSKNIQPVAANTDDLYMILRTRLFKSLPDESEIKEIAKQYRDAVNKQRKMGSTNYSADSVYSGILETYPFHSSIKDLFARFKENINFQQTRGFIRLTKQMVKELYSGDFKAKQQYLINAYDIDLNDSDMVSMIRDIKPKLLNAISHDICSAGRSVAEEMAVSGPLVMKVSKLILVSSLGDVVGVIQGLNESEIAGILSAPDTDLTDIKNIISEYKTKAWYLYIDSDSRYFFKDIKNVNAELRNIVDNYGPDIAKKEIKNILQDKFAPKLKDCYQKVLVFPAIDDISTDTDKITLVLFEPQIGGGLSKDLKHFYDNTSMKNRYMFLSGEKDTMDSLLMTAKELKGIKHIIQRLKTEEHISETDNQYILALDIEDKTRLKFLSTLRETFVTLYYPTKKGLRSHEIEMKFNENNFNAEELIRKLLIEVDKFTVDTTTSEFKEKIEARIFTANPMKWSDVQRRAAETEGWTWYKPSSLNEAKNSYISKGYWVEKDGMVDKNPPLPKTSVSVRTTYVNDDTGEITLKITPYNGDEIHYEIGDTATSASAVIKNPNEFKTTELKLSFLCVDSTGKHDTGDAVEWKNKSIDIKYRFYDSGEKKMCELQTNNSSVKIMYTVDGSSPRASGATYVSPFIVKEGSSKILAIIVDDNDELYGEQIAIDVPEEDEPGGESITINKERQLILTKKFNNSSSSQSFEFLDVLEKHNAIISCISDLTISKKEDDEAYMSVALNNNASGIAPKDIKDIIDIIDRTALDGATFEVVLSVNSIEFKTGQDFEDWVAERRDELIDYKDMIKQ